MSNTQQPIRGFYAVIPADVRYDENLTPNAKLLYGEITALCNEYGECQVSNGYFADLYGVTTTSISTWISGLQKWGYLNTIIDYKTNIRTICLGSQPTHENVLSGGVKEIFHTSERKLNSNNKETNKENNKNKYKDEPKPSPLIDLKAKSGSKAKSEDYATMNSMVAAYSQDPGIREALMAYLSQRKKKGLTSQQWGIILGDLKKFAGDDVNLTIEKVRGAFAGGYMQIIATWEKPRQTGLNRGKAQFDNTSGSSTPTTEPQEDVYVLDEQGNPVGF